MKKIILHSIGDELGRFLSEEERANHAERMSALDASLEEKVDTVHQGWGERYVNRVHAKNKLTTWERIESLIDPGTEVFEVGTLVNWGREFQGSKRQAPGAGVVTCFARVEQRWVMVIANDNTVASGAWWPKTPEKIERAQEMALRLRLPVVYLVDCSGLFLPEQNRSFSGGTGAGHIFTKNARLAAAGVPQIAGVFGDCIAGGGYMPIISDRVFMTEGAYMVIAGAALIQGAKSLKLTSLDIGGPEVHVHQSACADVRVPDDPTALTLIRESVSQLPSSAASFYRHGTDPAPPWYDPEELGLVFPPDSRRVYDIDQVIARLVDASMFHEVMGHIGREMVTGVARISGLWVGIIANRQGLVDEPGFGKRPGGVLYREGIAKISAFARACNADGIPLLWLQDISGFDIGVQAERLGLLGYGSNLIYGNSTATVPVFTVLLRKASGAGYYAMSGMPYEPVVQLSTPITRLAVMEGRTLAIAAFNSKLDDNFEIATTDPEERAAIEKGMADTAARIEGDMDPVDAASRMDTDEVVPLGKLRAWLECLVESAWQASGARRTKNPRIWSLHDLSVLTAFQGGPGEGVTAILREDQQQCPTVGEWVPGVGPGTALKAGMVLGTLRRAGRMHVVRAAKKTWGVVSELRPAGPASFGDALLTVSEGVDVEGGGGTPAGADADVLPPGVEAVCADTDGTIYLSPDPASPEFAPEGGDVGQNQTLALVEVMKTFSPVRSPFAGAVVRVHVEDAAPVEAGQVLFWVKRS